MNATEIITVARHVFVNSASFTKISPISKQHGHIRCSTFLHYIIHTLVYSFDISIWTRMLHSKFKNFNCLPHDSDILRLLGWSLLITFWKNKKMLVTRIFSFSHNIFYSVDDKFHHLGHIRIFLPLMISIWTGLNWWLRVEEPSPSTSYKFCHNFIYKWFCVPNVYLYL